MSECEKCTDSYYYKRYKIVQAENAEQAEQITRQGKDICDLLKESQRLKEALEWCIDEWVSRGKYKYGEVGCPASIFLARDVLKAAPPQKESE